jgi:hypothetical protein
MNRKDRIAVVVTAIYTLLSSMWLAVAFAPFVLMLLPAVCYWAYRFIQNDISFLKIKND